MRLTSCLAVICLVQMLSNANATQGKYTVIAPGTIHCNEKYTAAVALHNTSQPCQIKVGISGRFYNETKHIHVAQNEVKIVEFVLPCLEEGDFNLTAEGIDCLDNFKNTTKLIYTKFNNHVIIQTDKTFYEPGDEINFRVLFMDKDLRPARQKQDAMIWIEDGKRNRVKEVKGFRTIRGVYTGKFKISEFPVRGDWCLGVQNGGELFSSGHFEVNRFVLPKFIVKVKATKSISVKEGVMPVVVRANYNYGKPVEGKATVVFFLGLDHRKSPIFNMTVEMVKGKAKLDLNIKEHLPHNKSPSHLSIVAMVEEKFTGVEINSTASTTIYPYRYAINCIKYNEFNIFEVHKEIDVLFQITYVNGSYLNDITSAIELIYKQVLRKNSVVTPLSENRTVSFKVYMNETGFVTFNVALPVLTQHEGHLHYYSLELKYLDEQHDVCNTHLYWDQKQASHNKRKGTSKKYFILEDKYSSHDKLYLKKASQFTLNSSQPLSYFDYNVIGRGNILESGRIKLPDKPKVYNLTLTPQFSWAPKFWIYVNYVDKKGEYRFDEQPYEVVLELENQINVTVAKQVRPGGEVALKIQTASNSFVGLMAVDQSSLFLRSNNDLNSYAYNWALSSYSTDIPPQDGYSKYPGKVSGCVTLTNADYFYSRIRHQNIRSVMSVVANKVGSIKAGYANNENTLEHLAQTLLFADIENTEESEFIWTVKVPKTVTSWVLTAFSLNPQKGLGVTREETKITTFLPFYIYIRLPFSVKRDEVINVPAWVVNHLGDALNIEITLDNTDNEYKFIKFDKAVIYDQKLTKSTRVPANGAAGVSFLLKPKVVGNVMLKFTASSAVADDTIHKSMEVVAEGITLNYNRAYFVNLDKESEYKSSFALEIPQDLVPGTVHIEVGVMGDILGPVLNNLDNLVGLPTGCSEQTLSTLLSSYLVMKYLKDSKRLTAAMKTNLLHNLETGYQNILNYRHTDGSFSSFGPSKIRENPHNGSALLTAYVVRYLIQIKEFISVDEDILELGFIYLTNQQVENGAFTESGNYAYALQRYHIGLTCAAILAIIENATYAEKYSEELKKGLDFIAQKIGKTDSLQAVVIGAFTLNKAKHEAAGIEIKKLKVLAKTESHRIWWSTYNQKCGHRWWCYPFSSDVEITSYALLTLMQMNCTTIDDMLPIVNWLIEQRNSYGGFASAQDTVVGLTALFEFAKFANFESSKMKVHIESFEKKQTLILSEANEIMYQNIKMPPETKSINFTAKGTGSAFLQIAYQYNVVEMNTNPNFAILIYQFDNKNTALRLNMSVCFLYVGEGEYSNMAVLEFSTPSGYVIDDQILKEIKKSTRVSNTELKYSDTRLVVHFDHLYKHSPSCLPIQAIRTHTVAMQKPTTIALYDYYDTSKEATVFYEIESKLCDICETEAECSECKQGMVI